ncbi:MAG: DUF1573 domain-containing protein [Bacteroidales bacterium]|nr:DUF1573 domain-containing protein [Bacteroidales bacterium]
MKKLVCWCCALVPLVLMAQPKASFDKNEAKFGDILWKKPVTATFRVTNTGDKPLVITNVTTSCGCTVASWTMEPIQPGNEGLVMATFDAKQLGRFIKSVGIYCNAADKPIYLKLSGTVKESVPESKVEEPVAVKEGPQEVLSPKEAKARAKAAAKEAKRKAKEEKRKAREAERQQREQNKTKKSWNILKMIKNIKD